MRWQIVLHPRWAGVGSDGPWPPFGRNRGCMFERRIRLGFIQLRRFTYGFPHREPTIKVAAR